MNAWFWSLPWRNTPWIQHWDIRKLMSIYIPDSKVHGANMGPTWVLSAPDGPHIVPMDLAIRNVITYPCADLSKTLFGFQKYLTVSVDESHVTGRCSMQKWILVIGHWDNFNIVVLSHSSSSKNYHSAVGSYCDGSYCDGLRRFQMLQGPDLMDWRYYPWPGNRATTV